MPATGRKQQITVALIAAPLILAALYPLQKRIDTQTRGVQQEREHLLLQSGRVLKKLSLGYDSLLANIYWTRAVQYYGGKLRDHDPNFQLLWPLLDVTTQLDPHLMIAYKFGALFLAEKPPKGAGRPDLAVQLIQRAIEKNPDDWRLWHDLGFIYYWDLKDYQKAADAYLRGSKYPQAREWMRVMAARIAAEGGSRETSRFLWTEVYNSTRDPLVRKNAVDHLKGLRAEDLAERIEQRIAEFQRRAGRPPSSWQELIAAGLLSRVPADPDGYPMVLTPEGKIQLHPESPISSEALKPTWKPQF